MSNGYSSDYTISDHRRLLNSLKGIRRGVYAWKKEYTNTKRTKYKNNVYRVVFKTQDKKAKTFLYTDDKLYAEMAYIEYFEQEFGYSPYLHNEIGF